MVRVPNSLTQPSMPAALSRDSRGTPLRMARLIAAAACAAIPATSLAHVDEGRAAGAGWQFTPDIVTGSALVVLLYVSGLRALRARAAFPPARRIAAFLCGVALVFVALQSPIDALSEHSFAVHQIQHLLLHSAGPMLIMLSAPQAQLIAGSPAAFLRFVIAPIMGNRPLRAAFRLLSRPAAATLLFIGSLYFWELPRFHDLAVLDEPVHYAMHLTMLFAGLVFFWCVFDSRPAPLGARYGARMAMLWSALLGSILLGAVTTLKQDAWYAAYGELGRIGGLDALLDERLGGLVIWIPGSMMCVIGALVVIRLWGGHETKADLRRRRHLPAAAAGPARRPGIEPSVDAANRALAFKLVTIAVAVFAAILAIGYVIVSNSAAPG